MLVFTRKKGEKIILDNCVVLTVLDVRNGRIKVGIEAPEDVAVIRAEVCGEFKLMTEEPPASR